MDVGVRRVRTLDGVPTDRDAMIVQSAERKEGLSVEIHYRCTGDHDRAVDKIVYRKCAADQAAALRLAVDLALLGGCDWVYVLGDFATRLRLPPPTPSAAR